MNKEFKVYLLTFPNGKQYCGYTSRSLQKRWNNGKGYDKCPLMKRAIDKYGWINVKKELLFTFDNAEEALNKEKEIIAEKQLTNQQFGYNLDSGGKPHGTQDYITDITRQKLSQHSKAMWENPEFKQKMKLIAKKHPPTQQCIEASKIATSKRRKGVTPTNIRGVYQIDLNTKEIINSYISLTHASIALTGTSANCSNIRKVCLGQRKTALGFEWRFINNELISDRPGQ